MSLSDTQVKNNKIHEVLDQLDILLTEPSDEDLDPGIIQKLLALSIKSYGSILGQGVYLQPFPNEHGVTSTEVVLTVVEMLEAVNVEIFELGMFKSFKSNG